jgi:hypothetical protein
MTYTLHYHNINYLQSLAQGNTKTNTAHTMKADRQSKDWAPQALDGCE